MSNASTVGPVRLWRLLGRYAPHLIVLGMLFAFGVGVSFAPSILVFSIFAVPMILVASIAILVAAVVSLLRGRGKLAIWQGAFVPLLLIAPWPLLLSGQYAGWIGHLLVCEPFYEAQISKLDSAKNDRLKLFDWGSYLIFNDIYLAYDESDELRWPESAEPRAFQARLASQIVDPHWDVEAHLWGHYYIVDGHS
ncbi:MAG TPA: hypothetical protein VMU37_08665 [Caulobacteraceae bacterium]|nr:hypothetical protein [Caulobacteraceae bacterium]